jgi:hypothetical protein
MALLLKNGAVFLHIPKTGGTWVRHVLKELDMIKGRMGHSHSDYERAFWHDKLHHDVKVVRYIVGRAIRYSRAQVKMEPGCFKFCFVREPLSWYESWWRYMQSTNWPDRGNEHDPYRWDPNSVLNGLGSPDFNTFMYNVNKKRPGYVTEMYGWYVRPGIGFVGKQECLRQDLIKAFSLMKLDVYASRILSVPAQNETPSHVPKPEWDPVLRKETLRLEYAGYVRFGYPVEGEQLESAPKNGLQAEMSQPV